MKKHSNIQTKKKLQWINIRIMCIDCLETSKNLFNEHQIQWRVKDETLQAKARDAETMNSFLTRHKVGQHHENRS